MTSPIPLHAWLRQLDAAEWDRRLVEAEARDIEEGRWWRGIDVDRVKVKPGIYTFTHHYSERGFDRNGENGQPVIFAHIERRDFDDQATA